MVVKDEVYLTIAHYLYTTSHYSATTTFVMAIFFGLLVSPRAHNSFPRLYITDPRHVRLQGGHSAVFIHMFLVH